jgi:nucleoside-diphosphate-sugar epimerase
MDSSVKPQVLVLGGGSLVGSYLLPLLAERGYQGYVVSRKKIETGNSFSWLSSQEVQSASWHLQARAIIISLWPIWLLGPVLTQFLGASQLIALSSTSLFGKAKSLDPEEQELVKNIAVAEEQVRVNSETFRIPYTILRPTLIYDCINDHSITFIASIIRKFGFFLVSGTAAGLRQPIHAQDVAIAIVNSIGNEKVYNKSLNVAGGETITYFTMIRRVSEAVGRKIHIIPCPKGILKGLLQLMRMCNLTDLSPSLFDRMNHDLAYDSTEAETLLNFHPRDFLPEFLE